MVRNRCSSSIDNTDERATTNAARTVASLVSSIGLSNGFALADFIVPTVVEYLGIRSLVCFGTVCKDNRGLLSIEVKRRRAYVAEIEVEVMQLMRNVEFPSGGVYCERHMRASVSTMRLISRECFVSASRSFLKEIDKGRIRLCIWQIRRFFQERMKFLRLPTVGSLYIFPNEFYFSPVSEVIQVSEEKINALTGIVSRRWETIRHCSEDATLKLSQTLRIGLGMVSLGT